MTFPVYLGLGSWQLHPHLVCESLAYTLGFQLWRLRSRSGPLKTLPAAQKLALLVACILGAIVGARLLAWIETPWNPLTGAWIAPGKTIVGGLLGGWAGIEAVKARFGITARTGDAYVLPLCVGIALGRVGCFLTGLADHTYGLATQLPWGVDFGDGPRHPTQLYEAAWLLLLPLSGWLLSRWRRDWPAGAGFQAFMAAYLLFRFGVEWIKPTLKIYAGLSAIQWASLLGAGVALHQLYRLRPPLQALPEPA